MPDIACRGVRKVYATAAGSVEALHGVDTVFPAGQLSALVGPSGCGKSTLLRLIAGLDGVDAGSIATEGHDVAHARAPDLRRYRRDVVTYVAQRAVANLVEHMRLRDHFESSADVGLLEPLGLAGHAQSRPDQLSGGEQARAALAVALARRTPVVLLDEPTAELDRETASHVVDELVAAARRGVTVIVATHDADVVAQADNVVEMAGAVDAAGAGRAAPARADGAPLVVRGLTKHYGSTHAVDDVSLELPAGQTGVVLGRSGSGKSTLLMLLGGWLPADAGDTGVPSTDWAEVGYLPQRFGLLPELSVAENVDLPLRLSGRPDPERTRELLDVLGLGDLAAHLPGETSVGQQQRIALARALVLRPRFVLADEPTSHQDRHSADLVWRAIAEARDAGACCMVATHDTAATAHADRVWHIEDGRLAG